MGCLMPSETVKVRGFQRLSWPKLLYPWMGALLLALLVTPAARAQVTSDGTLGTSVNTAGGVADITGGTQAGRNLFHSFSQFSLDPSGVNTALFSHDPAVQNIITRVTGGSASSLNGRIQTGNVNLFFLNPSGIIFGDQAAIEIGGSFIASTANSLTFAEGQAFSSSTPAQSALLLVNVPIGLQYGPNPAPIQVQGTGSSIFVNFDPFQIVRDFRPPGVAVQPGRTLALIGGDVNIQGGTLTAADGQIAIGAAANTTVALTAAGSGWNFTYPADATLRNVVFSQGGSADVSGNGSGQIQIQAQRLSVLDGSVLLALTLGDGPGGKIAINAPESVTVQGGSLDFPSSLLTEVDLAGTGTAGSLVINTGRFLAAEGAKVSTGTSGAGNGGLLQITADTIEVNGGSPDFGATQLTSSSVGVATTGSGGPILLKARALNLVDGGAISVSTEGVGNTGTLQVVAQTVNLAGNSPDFGPSGIFATTFPDSTGQGGLVSIQSDRLQVVGGAVISLDTSGAGNAGSLTIQTNHLRVADGSSISVDTFGAGNTGNLQITAQSVEIAGISAAGDSSQITARVRQGATGNGGSLNVQTDALTLRDQGLLQTQTEGDGKGANLTVTANQLALFTGGTIRTSTFGLGDAGTLQVTAPTIVLDNGPTRARTGIFSSAERGASGKGGGLQIDTQRLQILGGAQIASATFGTGRAGDLTVNAQQIELAGFQPLGSSGLFASALSGTGAGGDLRVNTDRLVVRDGAVISASNFPSRATGILPGQGPAGNVTLQANNMTLDRGTVTASTATGGKGNVQVRSQLVLLKNGSLIAANAQGTEPGGNIGIDATFVVGNGNSDITANAINAQGGRVVVNAQGIYGLAARDRLTPDNDITASSELGVAFNGIVQLNTPDLDPSRGLNQLATPFDQRPQIVASCERVQGNEFVITGRGGLPESASQPLRGGTVWSDVRLSAFARSQSHPQPIANPSGQTESGQTESGQTGSGQTGRVAVSIVEAQQITTDPQGNVVLSAQPPAASSSLLSQAIACPAR
jgi:filamentous hemagglutinin family protein